MTVYSSGMISLAANGGVARVAVRDLRSIRLQDQLRAKWRDVKRMAPAARERWLKSDEGQCAIGEVECRRQLALIAARRKRLRERMPGRYWSNAWYFRGEMPPGLAWGTNTAIVPVAAERRHEVRLMLSRECSRNGDEGVASRRWTPPQSVDVEDMLDAMTPKEAAEYEYAASPSAEVIGLIAAAAARPVDGKW